MANQGIRPAGGQLAIFENSARSENAEQLARRRYPEAQQDAAVTLFGGPRACTHTTALLQAMAPVAIQCMWSMRASDAQRSEGAAERVPMKRSDMWKMNLNTCHVWAEDSDVVTRYAAGGTFEVPVFAQERMVQLGMTAEDWARRMGS